MDTTKMLSILSIIFLILAGSEGGVLLNTMNQNTKLKEENNQLISDYNNQYDLYAELNESYNTLSQNYTRLQTNYDSLESNYTELEASHNALNVTYYNLLDSYTELDDQFNNITSLYNIVIQAYNSLNQNYSILESSYNILNNSYQVLTSNYTNLEYDYNTLLTAYNDYIDAYKEVRSIVNFYVLHPKEEDQNYITPDDPAVVTKVIDITGGWSNTSDWIEFWGDLKELYDWVVNNIEYSYDQYYPFIFSDPSSGVYFFGEIWQYPNQTLELRQGDCDDMAILLTSMIYCYTSKQYWVECIGITGHLAVYLPVSGDQICILDPSGQYYTNTGSPSYIITSKDIDIEVNDWLNYWDIDDPDNAPHNVFLVFSAYIYREFTDTTEFTNWLYDRIT